MKQVITYMLTLCTVLPLCAQDMVTNLKSTQPGKGKVVLHQDVRLEMLLGKPAEAPKTLEDGEKQYPKMPGFRVQVYAGNNSRAARNEAAKMSEKVKELFPELMVYTQFINPRWICRVGDYRSIEEAEVMMRQLKETGEFKEVTIVRGQINIIY